MNIFKKWDRIPPPYSTIVSLVLTIGAGGILMFFRQPELGFIGVGIIIGSVSALLLKKAGEVSDRKVLGSLATWLQGDRPNSEQTESGKPD